MEVLLGLLLGGCLMFLYMTKAFGPGFSFQHSNQASPERVASLLQTHFHYVPIHQLSVSERRFPFRMRADLQRTIDTLMGEEFTVHQFLGVQKEYAFGGISMSDCMIESEQNPAVSVPPEYEELDIGEDQPLRVLKEGLWLLERKELHFAVLLSPCEMHGETTGLQIQVATPNSAEGTQLTQMFFSKLEEAVSEAHSYRGKILSLEQSVHSFSGQASGITVHKLRQVERDQVILPELTLALLEKNVVQFVNQRPRLRHC